MPGLLDVNALVALAWDSHVHHVSITRWFDANAADGWCTCPVTESGFVRVSSNPVVLPAPITVSSAVDVLRMLRETNGHRFLPDDVSVADDDVPPISGHRQVTDANLITLARRNRLDLVTFDRGAAMMANGSGVILLGLDESGTPA